jgi:hypothetical protein
MIAVAPVIELVEVEGYPLTLAGRLVARAPAVPVFPGVLSLAGLAALRAGHGAHARLPLPAGSFH